ncbi:hypothetical protein ruthe_01265 [Rubellimicrobium thermophilum DSM 16684]|uniref:Uncharacterized protein n=1 Tax=Rubellimicrobium thermophilum DSM 16684 TaxID=1123069 RepID=S9S8F9_9RHOB|nr:hypothetical protein ruthe_01265 [Rubellimicrobium thermophilum DSM 16684]
MAPPPPTEETGRRSGQHLHPPHDGGGGTGRQGRRGVGIGEVGHRPGQPGEGIAIKRLGRQAEEMRIRHQAFDHRHGDLSLRGQRAAVVPRKAAATLHQIVDGRVGGTGVEGEERPRLFGPPGTGIEPGEIAYPPQIEDGNRLCLACPARQRPVIEGGKRRPLAPQTDIGGAEVPDHGQAEPFGQSRAIARLMGAPSPRLMREGLAVKADDLGPRDGGEKFGMGVLDDPGRGFDRLSRPVAERRTQHAAFGVRIGAIGGGTEALDPLAIGEEKGRIHPIERGARHRPERAHRGHLPLPGLHPYDDAPTPPKGARP